jgi:hypothetical protein
MKKWGLVVTLFYGLVVLAFLVPAHVLIVSNSPSAALIRDSYSSWLPWTSAGAVMLGAILLLWLSADTTQRRLKPRTHIIVSALTIGLFMAVLTIAIILAVGLGVWGEDAFRGWPVPALLLSFAIPWLVWGILFYRFCHNCSDPISRGLAWMFRGSVLELLIAVPAHIVMRRRHDCSAPAVNGFGIAAGISIMLLSFGPSVLLLFKKRMEAYAAKTPAEK